MIFFFFFKQKTAYELRISDWSSDVCSSDLQASGVGGQPEHGGSCPTAHRNRDRDQVRPPPRYRLLVAPLCPPMRSEEHTSELQSLMRISYAVFCLKKKKKHHINHNNRQITQSNRSTNFNI